MKCPVNKIQELICKKGKRLQAAERKQQILDAVTPHLAKKGAEGMTTKEMANVAGVSEALLFKHFPNKESIYEAIQLEVCSKSISASKKLVEATNTTETLVLCLFFLVKVIVDGHPGQSKKEKESLTHLILSSLKEEGAFVKDLYQRTFLPYKSKFIELFQAAEQEGSFYQNPSSYFFQVLLVHHLIVGLQFHLLPQKPVLKHEVKKEDLYFESFLFALRGVGLREKVITRFAKKEKLEKLYEGLFI